MAIVLDGTTGINTPAVTGITTPVSVAQGGTGLASVGTSGNLLTSNGTAWVSTAPPSGSQWTTSGSDIYYSTGKVLAGLSTPVSGGASLQTANGLTFPATQSAISNANTLDDYEEGTWSPVPVSFGISGAYASYGYYIKVGRFVWISMAIYASAGFSATGGTSYYTGLPFAPLDNVPCTTSYNGNRLGYIAGHVTTDSRLYSPTLSGTTWFNYVAMYQVA